MIDGAPFEVLEIAHQHIGRGGSSVQTKIRHCVTGQVLSRNYKQADAFREAEIEKKPMVFLYRHRGAFVLSDPGDQTKRVTLSEETVGENTKWLKPATPVTAVYLEDKIISLSIPIKMDLKVIEAPPGLRGDTAQGGAKPVTLETGAVIQAPLFINQDDVIRINTETGTYVERVAKA